MPTRKTPKLPPPIALIDEALNPQGLTVRAMLSRLRCHNPGCNCHFLSGKVHCPCSRHKDRTPSFSITQRPEGIVAECHTRFQVYAETMDCKPEGLQAALAKMLASSAKIEIPEVEPKGTFYDWDAATRHGYRGLDRRCVYQVGRLGEGSELEIRARRHDPDHNPIYNLDGVVPILYQLLHLRKAQLVIVCDNERAADVLNKDLYPTYLSPGIVATTTMEGAAHLHRTDLSPLFGKELFFFPSEDGGQHLYANALIQALDGRAKVRIIEVPDRGVGGDYTHFRAAGHTLKEAIALIHAVR